ncbi:MAG: siderophore biosynthesis protein [Bacteroides sp.]|nr:siderophore biosynthesis protein [Bacteroides sp.]MDD4054603.1 siderophore biosynthesis protein [Bacteroides sp.]
MPLMRIHKNKTHSWGIWKMQESLDELLLSFDNSSRYENEIENFSSSKRQLEYITTRILLKHMLGEEKRIAYHPNGKPYLSDNSYHISISHSGDFVAIILSNQYVVGIDIEKYGMKIDSLVSRFIRLDESPTVFQGEKRWSYLLHWSAKEVVFKILNEQNVDFKKHLKIEPFQTESYGSFLAQESRTVDNRLFNIFYRIYPEFVLTWSVVE